MRALILLKVIVYDGVVDVGRCYLLLFCLFFLLLLLLLLVVVVLFMSCCALSNFKVPWGRW
jgi:hypothetical protein